MLGVSRQQNARVRHDAQATPFVTRGCHWNASCSNAFPKLYSNDKLLASQMCIWQALRRHWYPGPVSTASTRLWGERIARIRHGAQVTPFVTRGCQSNGSCFNAFPELHSNAKLIASKLCIWQPFPQGWYAGHISAALCCRAVSWPLVRLHRPHRSSHEVATQMQAAPMPSLSCIRMTRC